MINIKKKNWLIVLICLFFITTIFFVFKHSQKRDPCKLFENCSHSVIQVFQNFFPSLQQNDVISENQQINSGLLETKIFRTDHKANFENVSQTIFSGKMALIQTMPEKQFLRLLLCVFLVGLLFSIIDRFRTLPGVVPIVLGTISILSILISLRLSVGWDEFFINLRHAYMLLNHGVYSINAKEMIEGTVDFIPLLITTLFGLIKIPLIDAFIITSLMGNIVVIVFSYLIVKKLTEDRTWSLIAALLMGLYPNVVLVGGTGFSAVLFSGWILAGSYFFLFTNKRIIGLILLSTLTLVRTEGILFAVILIAFTHLFRTLLEAIRTGEWKSAIKNVFFDVAIIFMPFLLSLVVRNFVFGHSIPNPVSFKNTHFDQYYLASGIERFLEMVSHYRLYLLTAMTVFLIVMSYFVRKRKQLDGFSENAKKLFTFNIAVFIFILPYYIGGGDWFPMQWNRYGMPFNLVLGLTFLIFLHDVFLNVLKGRIRTVGLYLFLSTLIFIYSVRPIMSDIKHSENRWPRIDRLASLGQFLNEVLPKDAVVSSPEEATIMYFSEREMLGLLGVSNPDMSAMPLQPLHPGDILHRRRGYASVFKKRPDVIAPWEPVVAGDFGKQPDINKKIKDTLRKEIFNPTLVNVSYYRIGSYRALEKMGYQHISIFYPDRVFSIFVNKRIYKDFIKNIEAQGFKYYGKDFISYSVDPELSKKYAPAVKEIMDSL